MTDDSILCHERLAIVGVGTFHSTLLSPSLLSVVTHEYPVEDSQGTV